MDARQYFPHVAQRELEKNFAPYYFDGAASDANVNYPVIVLRRTHENPARTLHLDPLFNEHSLIGSRNAVRNHPRSGATRRRSSCWIFAVIEQHARMQAGCGVYGLASYKVEKPAPSSFQVFACAMKIDTEFLNHC